MDCAQRRNVLERHLRRAVLADRHAGVRAGQAVVRAADRGYADEVVGARHERGERRRERAPARHLDSDGRRDHLLLGDVHLEIPFRDGVAEDLGKRRVRDFAVETDDVPARLAERCERLAVGLPRRDLGAELVVRQLQRAAGAEIVPRRGHIRLRHVDTEVPHAAELFDRLVRVVECLAVQAVLVLDLLDALALDRVTDHDGRPPGRECFAVRTIDCLDIVALDFDRMPAERAGAVRVRVEIPAVHRLTALAEAIDVDDRDQVVEAVERRVLERLPLGALRDLAVAAQDPNGRRRLVELPTERDADADRQSLAERARGDVDPRDHRRRVALEPRAELAEREQLLVGDHPRGSVHRVQERRRVALREDEPVVVGIARVVEVVAQVLRQQHRHQIGRRHARGRVA